MSTSSEKIDDTSWGDDELRASVISYLQMRDQISAGEKVVKRRVYEALADRFGRTVKAYEFRMQNISHVLNEANRPWIAGLKPKKNVGGNVMPRIEKFLSEAES